MGGFFGGGGGGGAAQPTIRNSAPTPKLSSAQISAKSKAAKTRRRRGIEDQILTDQTLVSLLGR